MDVQSDTPGRPLSPLSPRTSEGRNAPRSRKGCWTCRSKKVKCDEIRPQCRRCVRLKLLCDYMPRKRESRLRNRTAPSEGARSENEINFQGLLAGSPTSDWFQSLLRQDEARSIATFRIPVPSTSNSSVVLTASDHEAIRYFRTTFAQINHTKNPDFSLYSIMFKIAEVNSVVMHMVLAVGGREMEFQKRLLPEYKQGAGSPLFHYSNALKLMAELVGDESTSSSPGPNFDSLYTALYLMLLYEQRYGDEKCIGFTNHLNGTALILKHQYNSKGGLLPSSSGKNSQAVFLHGHEPKRDQVSLYAARIIMWIIQFDSSAASYGLGSQLLTTLSKLMSTDSGDNHDLSYRHLIDKLEQLHHFSIPLYRIVWGKEYPQSELLDDVENKNVFFLEGACIQLRFMVAQLADLSNTDVESEATKRHISDVSQSIERIRDQFSDLIDVAAGLSVSTNNSQRLVANLRRVVPLYYAVVLYFHQSLSTPEQALGAQQIEALRQIMNLAFQTHKHDGEKAIMRIAWPLFMVGLETNDHLHREWVLNRFSALSNFGYNFRRAYQFLSCVVELQTTIGRRVDVRGRLQSGQFDLFVI